MTIDVIVTSFVVLLLLALVAQPIAQWIRLPYATSLVMVGFIVSELLVMSGVDTGIRADNFQQLIFYVLLPVLIFQSAYSIDKVKLRQNLFPILFLSIAGMMLTCGLIAVGLYYGIAHAAGFPWAAALLTGAILAATDPVSVVSSLNEVGAPKRLSILLEGESLFNDATAIVVFSIFLSMALSSSATIDAVDAVIRFITVFLGGAVIGVVMGYCAVKIKRLSNEKTFIGVLSIFLAYSSFLVAEKFHVSGVMATLLAAVIMSSASSKTESYDDGGLWDVIGHMANAIVFIVMGVTITIGMFEDRWLAMLIAIGAVLVARAISIYAGLFVISKMQQDPIKLKSQSVMVWGGLRGAVTLALALSLPTTLDYWWTIQSIAFGVVVFSLFVQAPTIKLLVDALHIKKT